jgi:hypothetical protein
MIAGLAMLPVPAIAAAPQAPAGISVSPASVQLLLKPGQTSYSFTAYAANNTSQPAALTISAVDFSPQGTTGGIAFLGNNVSTLDNPHGLASWIQVSPTALGLAPHASQAFRVILSNVNTLAPGGHYTAVLLHVANTTTVKATNHVAVNQVVSMLVFTSTAGSGTQIIQVQKPEVGIAWFHMPRYVDLFIADNGNTQLTPQGYVTIYSGTNKPLSRAIINPGSALVLPGSTRLLGTAVKTPKQPFFPGRYRTTVTYGYAGSGATYDYNVAFTYIGTPAVIFIVVIFISLLSWLGWKAYRLRHRLSFRR